jgi:transcriptional regulator with XRE-family HTH domain
MAIKKLKQTIAEREMTTPGLSEKTGISVNTLHGWLYTRKPSNPAVKDLAKIAAALGVSMEYLMTGKESAELKEEERHLLSLFREMPKQRRGLLVRIAGVLKDDK